MKLRRQRRAALTAFVLVFATPAAAEPAFDYMLHCRGCHGPAGEGTPPDVPDLRGTIGQFLSIPGGREYLMRVPGVAQAELSDARVARLLSWMVRYYDADNVPADFVPFTAEEVAEHRHRPLSDAAAARNALLDATRSSARRKHP